MTIAHFQAATYLSAGLSVFGTNRMTAAGGTPPTGFSRGNFGSMLPDTVEGFDIDLVQTPITPDFITINIRTVTDLGRDYWKELQFRNTGNDPVWFDAVLDSSLGTYFFFGGVASWSNPGVAPGFFIQGSLYDLEWFR